MYALLSKHTLAQRTSQGVRCPTVAVIVQMKQKKSSLPCCSEHLSLAPCEFRRLLAVESDRILGSCHQWQHSSQKSFFLQVGVKQAKQKTRQSPHGWLMTACRGPISCSWLVAILNASVFECSLLPLMAKRGKSSGNQNFIFYPGKPVINNQIDSGTRYSNIPPPRLYPKQEKLTRSTCRCRSARLCSMHMDPKRLAEACEPKNHRPGNDAKAHDDISIAYSQRRKQTAFHFATVL